MHPALQLENLRVDLPAHQSGRLRTIVHDVTLSVQQGESVALVGSSGCGKTTCARAAVRLIRPTAGRVLVDGTPLASQTRGELRRYRRHMQMGFQAPGGSLNGRMRVRDLIAEPLLVHRLATRAEAFKQAGDLADQCGLPAEALTRWPHEFSGGQRQRICIARALASRPSLLVCDEPTSALDVSVQAKILNLLMRLQERRHLALLFITHDLGVARFLCDRIAVMANGGIIETGDADQILEAPQQPCTQALVAATRRTSPDMPPATMATHGAVPRPPS